LWFVANWIAYTFFDGRDFPRVGEGSTALKDGVAVRPERKYVLTNAGKRLAPRWEGAMIRLLIADDHTMFREVLRNLLAREPDFEVVAEAADWEEVLESAQNSSFDVMVLDLSMPKGNGIDVIRQLKTRFPATPILVLTMHHEERYAAQAIESGASGYITKDAAVQQLVVAIRRLAKGGQSIDPAIAQQLALAYTYGAVAHGTVTSLSMQELKIFEMLVSGKPGAQIARDLSLSHQTISTYKSRLLVKLNLKNQTDLVRFAIEHRLFKL
jgi:DNA-binding NarL/FixJ family response regulator